MLPKIRNLAGRASQWASSTRGRLEAKEKMSMLDAKSMLDVAEKLNITCDESKILRQAMRNAKGWANRVKRSKLDEGATHIDDVKGLLEEHDSLQIEMPDEATKLRQALKSYCICRRPYAGFMIGCDTCEEWYHGSCIGLSEARADRFNKYICIRCCTARMYKASAASIASLIRKWTITKERKKARQVEAQKHQRKVRKETKDIEKLQEEIEKLEKWISSRDEIMTPQTVEDTSPDADGSKLSAMDQSLCFQENHGIKNQPIHSAVPVNMETDQLITAEGNSYNPNGTDVKPDASDIPANVEDAKSKLDKAIAARQMCDDRLVGLAQQAALRQAIERKEDASSELLKRWFVRVRSLVLVPSTEARASAGRPVENGSLSLPMLKLIAEARTFGIHAMSDVDATINAFWCLSWSLRAATLLKRRPSLDDMRSLVLQSSSLALPDEKALRMMKSLIQRAASWQAKVIEALSCKPEETKPICLEILKDLADEGESIPLKIPEEPELEIAIEDKGARHCVCGGPSNGSVMLSCDKCDRWFHGRCMGVTKEESDNLSSWVCSPCLGDPLPPFVVDRPNSLFLDGDSDGEDFSSSTAAKDQPSWPPYGLLGSQEASDALGDCCAILDDVDDIIPDLPVHSSESVFVASQQALPMPTVLISASVVTESLTAHGVAPEPNTIVKDKGNQATKPFGTDIAAASERILSAANVPAFVCKTTGGLAAASVETTPSAEQLRPQTDSCGSVKASLNASNSETRNLNADLAPHSKIAPQVTGTTPDEAVHEKSTRECEDTDAIQLGDIYTESCSGLDQLSVEKLSSQMFIDPTSESLESNLSADEIGPIADMMVECEARHLDAIGTSV